MWCVWCVLQAAAAQPPVHDAVLDSVSLRAWLNAPYCSSLEQDLYKAANVLAKFTQVRGAQGVEGREAGGVDRSVPSGTLPRSHACA